MTKTQRPIFLVDDDPDDRMIFKLIFNDYQIKRELIEMADGIELMEYLDTCYRDQIPALIFLDRHMPKMDGMQVLQLLKANFVYRHIPVVIFSNSRLSSDKSEAYKLGANFFITKPPNITDLRKVIEDLLKIYMIL
ncbi:MAG: response regulator [Chitinophagaceae bacterium]|nr:response regulator [Chitinophagaceae bacterium]